MPSEQEQERKGGRRKLCEAEALLRAEQESERREKEPRPEQPKDPARLSIG